MIPRGMWFRIALLSLLSCTALADEIRLTNGDRITGELKARSGERLVVQTQYAGDISIRLSDVHSLSIVDTQGEGYDIGPLELATFDPVVYKTDRDVVYSGRALVSVAYARGNTESDQVHLGGDFTARARD